MRTRAKARDYIAWPKRCRLCSRGLQPASVLIPRKSAEQLIHFENDIGKCRQRDGFAPVDGESGRVGFRTRIAINEDHIVLKIFDPEFRNAVFCVKRHFPIATVTESRVGDFDNEKGIFWRDALACIVIVAWPGKYDIWLRLSIPAQENRILYTDHYLSGQPGRKECGGPIHTSHVPLYPQEV